MKTDKAKSIIRASSGYEATSSTLPALIDELRAHFGSPVIGSDITALGPIQALYVSSNGVAHMLSNEQDFVTSLQRMQIRIEAQKPAAEIVIPADTHSRYISQITEAVDLELTQLHRCNRSPDLSYKTQSNSETRTQTSIAQQIVTDLISGDGAKGVEALRRVMIR